MSRATRTPALQLLFSLGFFSALLLVAEKLCLAC